MVSTDGGAQRGPQPSRRDSLTGTTLRGLNWTYLQAAISAVLQIGVTALFARILSPTAFGLVAVGTLALKFINYFSRGGISQALIQKPEVDDLDIRAAFTASAALGTIFTIVGLALAPLAGVLFGEPDAVPVVRWMSLALLLGGLGAPATSLLSRHLRFRALAIKEVGVYLVSYVVVGLGLAWLGAGVYALVGAHLSAVGGGSLTSWLLVRHRLRPTLDRTAHRALFSFGGRVSLVSFLEFLGTNIDTVAVGRFVGTAPLGLYNRANLLVDLPMYRLTTGLSRVLFPVFSTIQSDAPRLRKAYLTSVQLTASIIFPVAAGMAAAAAELVHVLLGDQWLGAVDVVPWLALSSAVAMVNHFVAIVAEARAALNAKIAITATKVLLLVLLLWPATTRSLAWFGAALAGAALAAHAMYLILMPRISTVTLSEILGRYATSAASAVLVASSVTAVRLASLAIGAPLLVVFSLEVLTGALALVLSFTLGPSRGVRREAADRLEQAGILGGDGRRARLLGAVVGRRDTGSVDRPTPSGGS